VHSTMPDFKKRQKAEVARLLRSRHSVASNRTAPDRQAVCRQLLQLAPEHFDALHSARHDESHAKKLSGGEVLLSRAVAVDPRSAQAVEPGRGAHALQRYDEARESYKRLLPCSRNIACLYNLGNVCWAPIARRSDRELHNAIAAKATSPKPDTTASGACATFASCRGRREL